MMLKKGVLSLTALIVLPTVLLAGCISGQSEFPAELREVHDTLGYAVAPTYLPDGFTYQSWDQAGPLIATLTYQGANHQLFVFYPLEYSATGMSGPLWERLGLDWSRPVDAVSQVKVNGQTAYLVRGRWSAETLRLLERLDPDLLSKHTPVWDYKFTLSLYFEHTLSDGSPVGVRLDALMEPADWITPAELIKIAESFRSLE